MESETNFECYAFAEEDSKGVSESFMERIDALGTIPKGMFRVAGCSLNSIFLESSSSGTFT